jgi:NAD(P)-dependent dehydrogenase (short-subunit alcohol dehydrogenase family)
VKQHLTDQLCVSFFTSSLHMAQIPIDSGFGPEHTAADVICGIDLTGQIAIITGGYSGIGLETTKAFLSAGATVLVAVLTPEKAAAKLAGLAVETAPLDLSDPSSIDRFAAEFLASGRPLHFLINNAASLTRDLVRDSRGYESQFATNHLGPFHLTARLWPALVKANGARVVCVSSRAHFHSNISEDWNFESRPYGVWAAYGQSKTANVLFALALDARGAKFGVRAFSLHPGAIITTDGNRWASREENVKRWSEAGFCDAEGNPILNPLKQSKTPEQGASTSVWAATSPLLEGRGGLYLENNNISPFDTELVDPEPKTGVDARGIFGVKSYAVDPAAAERLWALSERLTGVPFAI